MAAKFDPVCQAPSDRNLPVWRLFQLDHALDLFHTGELHLTALHKFSDKAEGNWPNTQRANFQAAAEEAFHKSVHAGDDMARQIEEIPKRVCASCWTLGNVKSPLLWGRFGGDEVVALLTTFEKLSQAVPETCSVGLVQYVDYANGLNFPSFLLSAAVHKREHFADEKEVRIIHVAPEGSVVEYVRVKFDLSLMDAIYVTEHSEMLGEVQSAVDAANIRLKVEKVSIHDAI